MRAVSKKRARQQRERRKLAQRFHDAPACVGRLVGCAGLAVDLHEVLSRARGGSITDLDNVVPLCRPCHDYVTTHPDAAESVGLSATGFGRRV